jgi:hypothetical protein
VPDRPAPSAPRRRGDAADVEGPRRLLEPRLSAVWANTGDDKVHQHDLRRSHAGRPGVAPYGNPAWDDAAQRVSVWGARNEMVAFSVYLENAGAAPVAGVGVTFGDLVGPGGAAIRGRPAAMSGRDRGAALTNWTFRDIELFYVRYLPIRGCSRFGYDDTYNTPRASPERFRRPYDARGRPRGGWGDRPDHDRWYPDIAVPLELHPAFAVAPGTVQQVWVDVYVPRGAAPGAYDGTLTVRDRGGARDVRVRLTVRDFALPDRPAHRSMLMLSQADFNRKFSGDHTRDTPTSLLAARRAHALFHRHKIGTWHDSSEEAPTPIPPFKAALLGGRWFTAAEGYRGPGEGRGPGIYVDNHWYWTGHADQPQYGPYAPGPIQRWADALATQASALDPEAELFAYLLDEPGLAALPVIEGAARALGTNGGPGRRVKSFVTVHATRHASRVMPSLRVFCAGAGWAAGPYGGVANWRAGVDAIRARGGEVWWYNGLRPGSGSFMTEDAGGAIRMKAWAAARLDVRGWFFWNGTYWYQWQTYGWASPHTPTRLFHNAATYAGNTPHRDAVLGLTAASYSNGDGVLCYPLTDLDFPDDSYGVVAVAASLRAKHWRRGIQDGDYIALARAVAPAATDAVVRRLVPRALWEYERDLDAAPQYEQNGGGSTEAPLWPEAGAAYEAARAALADLIEQAAVSR